MKISFFGSSLVSAYWNGAATYYRGLICALHARGHSITFFEPDAYGRQQHRDIDDPDWADVVVYPATEEGVERAVGRGADADLIVKASGVGVFDEYLDEAIADRKSSGNCVAFWDVDAPATLDRVSRGGDPFATLIPKYDIVFTYGGGEPVVTAYRRLGARQCVPVYNALDRGTHYPVTADSHYAGALAFLGNRLPDREARVEEFFLKPAACMPEAAFLLGGAGWGEKQKPRNVRYFDHVYTKDHNAFNCSPLAVLNVSRESMARYGYSPATRIFEAAGAAACIITDFWVGIEQFFEPDREILVACDGDDVVRHLRSLTPQRARAIGEAAYRRVTAAHTYSRRAELVETALDGQNVASPLFQTTQGAAL
jgi:spore maturation protein CgeB